jgi:hypothetical protein
MRHLFSSVVKAEQMVLSQANGIRSTSWAPAGSTEDEKAMLAWIPCRIDLQFVRPGKDAPVAIQAGQAPERFGILFCGDEYYGVLRPGMRLVTIDNAIGQQPVRGIFDLRAIPDLAQDFSRGHHIETQVFEMLQPNVSTQMPESDGSYELDNLLAASDTPADPFAVGD